MQITIPKDTSKFLDKEAIKHKSLLTITSEGYEREEDSFDKKSKVLKQYIGVKLENGDEGDLPLNNTSLKNIYKEFGTETKDWIGKQVRAWETKTNAGDMYFILNTLNFIRDDRGEFIDSGVKSGAGEKSADPFAEF